MLLVTLIGDEEDGVLRESELHALQELGDTGGLDFDTIEPIRLLERSHLGASELEYVEYLSEEYLGRPNSVGPSD
jgi:hypothetical protein